MKTKDLRKIIISSFLIVCVIWIAVPKVYVHTLLGHVHATVPQVNDGTTIQTNEVKDDCEFDKFNSPVYFTIFKFINNLIPSKPKEQSFLIKAPNNHGTYEGQRRLLRAPPIA
jgi:hypothetical protein